MCPGQFIGFMANVSSSSTTIWNMFSRNFSQWPGDPERLVVDQRRPHLPVATPRVLAAAKVLERVEDRHSFRMPEGRAGRVLVEVEEIEPLPEHAMVATPCLPEPLEMRVEVGLRVERSAVDARELRLRRV